MKPPAFGTDRKRKQTPPGRGQRLSASADKEPLDETTFDATAAAAATTPLAEDTHQQFGLLKTLLRQLEQQLSPDSPPQDDSPQAAPDNEVTTSNDHAEQDEPCATEVLAALAQRFQQDDRLLAHRSGLATAAPRGESLESDTATRRQVSIPAGVIPLAAGGKPDLANSFSTTIVSVEGTVIGMQTSQVRLQPGACFVAGVEGIDGVSRYAVLKCTVNGSSHDGKLLLAHPAPASEDLLCRENLLPSLDRQHARYEMRLSPRALAGWVELGVLRPRLLDRILVCPRCFALPTVRSACEHCGGIDFRSERLMHHFACAFVAALDEFQQEDELVCPKCRMRHLVVGTDFEYLDGPFQCGQCAASSNDLALMCQCLECDHRYCLTDGIEQDLVGYDVDRLDILALGDNA